MPCLTNIGRMRSAGCSRVCTVSRRSAGVDRSRRAARETPLTAPIRDAPRTGHFGSPSSGLPQRQRVLGQRVDQRADGRRLRLHVDPQAELLAVAAVCGPITATTVRACGLPAMPTRLRTVHDEVKHTASNPPDLIASRMSRPAAPPVPSGTR